MNTPSFQVIAENNFVTLISPHQDALGQVEAGAHGQAVSSVRAGTVLVEFDDLLDDDRVRLVDIDCLALD